MSRSPEDSYIHVSLGGNIHTCASRSDENIGIYLHECHQRPQDGRRGHVSFPRSGTPARMTVSRHEKSPGGRSPRGRVTSSRHRRDPGACQIVKLHDDLAGAGEERFPRLLLRVLQRTHDHASDLAQLMRITPCHRPVDGVELVLVVFDMEPTYSILLMQGAL